MSVRLAKPTVAQVPAILELIGPEIAREAVLPRTARQIAERLRDYTVALRGDEVVGVASISLVDLHLAEVGVLQATLPGIASTLLDAVLDEARTMGVGRAFVLTADPARFEAEGFTRRPVQSIPEKYERQCLKCARAPRCRQVALDRPLAPALLAVAG
jgi:amino-acid N-acetyltransferase